MTGLHAPTAEDLAARQWPLREIDDRWGDIPAYPAITDLLTVMDAHGIPRTAAIGYGDCGSHELVVTW